MVVEILLTTSPLVVWALILLDCRELIDLWFYAELLWLVLLFFFKKMASSWSV